MTWMELGDSFSAYGFSYEDMIMNTMGALTGYVTYKYPQISEKLDLRIEYIPFQGDKDAFTDYQNMKFIMAFKASGFSFFTKSILRYFEVHVGYYARDYDEQETTNKRIIYSAIGINISELFVKASQPKTAKVFHYYQVPYSYLPAQNKRSSNR